MAEIRVSRLELVILAALEDRELYGLGILDAASSIDPGRPVSLGGLYTTLHRMENKGLVDSRWGDESERGRQGARRRYYRITGLGQAALARERRVLLGGFVLRGAEA